MALRPTMWLWLLAQLASGAAIRGALLLRDGRGRLGEDVYYPVTELDRLKTSMTMYEENSKLRWAQDRAALESAASGTVSESDRAFLEKAAISNEEDLQEARSVEGKMLTFYHTLRTALGSVGTAPSCQVLQCGEHAECEMHNGFAACKCSQCYQGDGLACLPGPCVPAGHSAVLTLPGKTGEEPSDIAEVHVAVFARDHVAVVARDMSAENQGFLWAGFATADGMVWDAPQAFSSGAEAVGPVVVGLSSGRILIAYRDHTDVGISHLVRGRVKADAHGAPRAEIRSPVPLAKEQAQRMALVPLSPSRIACLFSARSVNPSGELGRAFGAAALVELVDEETRILGKFRFADMPVEHIAATALGPTSLVVAFRGLPDIAQEGSTSKELSATWIEMLDDELVVDTHALELEPDRQEMMGRGVALISQNVFAYSYESSTEKQLKIATIHVDPNTHRMTPVGEPAVISQGSAEVIQAISVPSGPLGPRSFTYFQKHGAKYGAAGICRVATSGRAQDCKSIPFADAALRTASGERLMDGRLLFVYADAGSGRPYYQFLGAQDMLQ
mmetsp:Transcript_55681/g.120299  ORF Transcript_55681/g.120299 Transcript_55681/m.120299 type:complete len:560 (-) Transcript_55681:84-1763(-)